MIYIKFWIPIIGVNERMETFFYSFSINTLIFLHFPSHII